MYTECPHCHTLFRIGAEELRAARGLARCGRCARLFNAVEQLREPPGPEEDGAAQTAARPAIGPADAAAPEVEPERPEPPPPQEAAEAPAPSEGTAAERARDEEDEDLPHIQTPPLARADEEERRVRRARVRGIEPLPAELREGPAPRPRVRIGRLLLGLFAALLLLALAAAQLSWYRAGELAAWQPTLRPWLEHLCAELGCDVTPPRAPQRIALLDHDVRSHPKVAGALLIKATIENQADFAQPFPDILVTLSDLTGTVVAQRRFHPREYLPKGMQVNAHSGALPLLRPHQPVYIDLEVIDPGRDAINYQFDFL